MPRWKINLYLLCAAQLISMTAFSAYLPFIPYYVQELGVTDYAKAAYWQALFDSGSATTMMLMGPIWGTMADRVGRKLMFVRATLAGSILAFIMGLVHTPAQLIGVRIIQGALCGTVSAANTLVATETPDEYLGRGLGLMQTTQYVGSALGPVLGGLGADLMGYRAMFPISAAMMFVSFAITALFVRETSRLSPERTAMRRSQRVRLRLAGVVTRDTATLMLALGSTSFGVAVLNPVLALYIKVLSPGNPHIATLAGTIVSASAVTASLSALALGRLADRIGQRVVLLACTIGAALIYVPQALATTAAQLLVLRAIQGIFSGGIMPTANALLARTTAANRRGTIFGLATSAQAGGRALGPMAGAATANAWGMASNFWVTGAIFAVIATLVGLFVRNERAESTVDENEVTAPAVAGKPSVSKPSTP